MNEMWMPIYGYESLYEVSNMGRVRSLPRKTTRGKILSPAIDKDGYYKVNLVDGERSKTYGIHRLVAQAFIENPFNLPVVNHKDENKQNNRADNLEYCTVKYNTNYNGATTKRGFSQRRAINQYDLDGNFIARWSGAIEIKQSLGYMACNISSVCQGHRKSAHGYLWRYDE
jgi:hypothetical protein